MSLFGMFRRSSAGSAPVARERLQVLLAHERTVASESDLVVVLREEILAVIAKRVKVEFDNVNVRMNCGETVSTLTVDIEIPGAPEMLMAANG
jgi:cell division topological specificity factor